LDTPPRNDRFKIRCGSEQTEGILLFNPHDIITRPWCTIKIMDKLIINIIKFGGMGCLIFSVFILFMAYTGIASEMRDEEGNFKKKRNLKTIFGIILFVSFLFGLLYIGNLRFIESTEGTPGLLLLCTNSFGIFFLIHLYDLIVIYYLVVVKWHPKFLKLPDTNYYRSFTPHLKGFVKGIPIGIGASFITSIITIWIN